MVKVLNCLSLYKKSYGTLSKGAIFFGQPCISYSFVLFKKNLPCFGLDFAVMKANN